MEAYFVWYKLNLEVQCTLSVFMSLRFVCLNAGVLAITRYTFGRSCERTNPLRFSVVFVDLRGISQLVTTIHVSLHLSSALLLKIFSLALSLYQRVIILLQSKQNSAQILEGLVFIFCFIVQEFTSGHRTLFISESFILSAAYLYQKDERTLPGNFRGEIFCFHDCNNSNNNNNNNNNNNLSASHCIPLILLSLLLS